MLCWSAAGCTPSYTHPTPEAPGLVYPANQAAATPLAAAPSVPTLSAAPLEPSPVASVSDVSREAAPVETRAVEILPFQRVSAESKPLRAQAPARRLGNLSPAQCAKELRNFKTSFKRVGAQKGIATPTRVVGLVGGVRFKVPGEKSKFGVLDCRLALTLVEFATFLEQRGIVEVVVDNFYRVNARLPGRRSKRSQHAYGLAIDLRSFATADGTRWDIEQDWGAGIETEPCGPLATLSSPTPRTSELRTLVCELFEQQIFSHHLTPSHDAAHRNHLHLDVKRGATSAVIR